MKQVPSVLGVTCGGSVVVAITSIVSSGRAGRCGTGCAILSIRMIGLGRSMPKLMLLFIMSEARAGLFSGTGFVMG